MTSLADILRELLEEKGITHEDLAARISLSPEHLERTLAAPAVAERPEAVAPSAQGRRARCTGCQLSRGADTVSAEPRHESDPADVLDDDADYQKAYCWEMHASPDTPLCDYEPAASCCGHAASYRALLAGAQALRATAAPSSPEEPTPTTPPSTEETQ